MADILNSPLLPVEEPEEVLSQLPTEQQPEM